MSPDWDEIASMKRTKTDDCVAELSAAVVQLRAERDAARAELATLSEEGPVVVRGDGSQCTMRVWAREMKAAWHAAQADARRYQWLRQRFRVCSPHIDGQHGWCAMGDIGRLRGPNLDAAIDAALKG